MADQAAAPHAHRIDAGPLIALVGAVLLLVSLFLEWFEPGISAWEVFEIVDLLLAAVAILAVLAALSALTLRPAGVDPRALGWAAGVAVVMVVAALLDHPPAAAGADPGTGLWLAFAGALVLALGALLTLAQVSVSVDVGPRRRRMTAVDARSDPPAADPPA